MAQNMQQPLVDPLAGEIGDEESPRHLQSRDTWGQHLPSEEEARGSRGSALDRSKTAPMGFAFTGGTATVSATIFNLINTVIGAGLLALPQAIEQNGVVIGIALVIVVAFLADSTIYMLLYAQDTAREKNFGRIAEVLNGPGIKLLVDVIIFLLNFGLCSSYCIIVGNNLVSYAQSAGAPHGSPWQDIRVLLAIVVVIILYPLSTLKQMNALRHVSLLCLIFITLFVVFIVIAAAGGAGMPVYINSSADINWWNPKQIKPISFMQNVPVIFFAFVCHMNVPLLYGELRASPKKGRHVSQRSRMMLAVHAAIGYCVVLYVIVAVAGYILFGPVLSLPENAGNILNAIHESDLSIAPYVKLVYAILLSLSFPVLSYSGRAALHRLLSSCGNWINTFGEAARYLEAAVIVLSTAGLAMTGVSVDVAFGLTGSITCTAIMYIFPGLFHHMATKRNGLSCCAKTLGIIAIAFGFIIMGVSTASIIIGVVSPSS